MFITESTKEIKKETKLDENIINKPKIKKIRKGEPKIQYVNTNGTIVLWKVEPIIINKINFFKFLLWIYFNELQKNTVAIICRKDPEYHGKCAVKKVKLIKL